MKGQSRIPGSPAGADRESATIESTGHAGRTPAWLALIAFLAIGVPAIVWLFADQARHLKAAQEIEIAHLRGQARALIHDGRNLAALERLNRILSYEPDDPDALRDRIFMRLALAGTARVPSRHEEIRARAIADADRLVSILPDASWPYAVRADLMERLGEPEQAAADRRMASRGARGSGDPYRQATIALLSGRYREAIDRASLIADQHPRAALAHRTRAVAYERLGEIERARSEYRATAGLDPEDFFPHYSLGRLLVEAEEVDDALPHLRRALELSPSNPYVLEMMARALIAGAEQTRRTDPAAAARLYREAERAAREALQLDADLPWSSVSLGAALSGQSGLREAPDHLLLNEAVRHFDGALARWEMRGATAGRREAGIAHALIGRCSVLVQMRDARRGVEACRLAAEVRPGDPDCHLRLAGAYALAGRPEAALAALEKSVDLGSREHALLSSDPCFDRLRDDPRFRVLLAKMRGGAGGTEDG